MDMPTAEKRGAVTELVSDANKRHQPAPSTSSISSACSTSENAQPHACIDDLATDLAGMKLGGIPFEELGLHVSEDATEEERRLYEEMFRRELARQKANPPTLPVSVVPDLPLKHANQQVVTAPASHLWFPKLCFYLYNNMRSVEINTNNKCRNTAAAKKSRDTRIEKVHVTSAIKNDQAAEIRFLRLKLISLGGDPSEWDNMDISHREAIRKEVADEVAACDAVRTRAKKQREKRARAARNAETKKLQAELPELVRKIEDKAARETALFNSWSRKKQRKYLRDQTITWHPNPNAPDPTSNLNQTPNPLTTPNTNNGDTGTGEGNSVGATQVGENQVGENSVGESQFGENPVGMNAGYWGPSEQRLTQLMSGRGEQQLMTPSR